MIRSLFEKEIILKLLGKQLQKKARIILKLYVTMWKGERRAFGGHKKMLNLNKAKKTTEIISLTF